MAWTMEGYQREYMSEWANKDTVGNMGIFFAFLGIALFGCSSWFVSRQPKPIIHDSIDPEKAVRSKSDSCSRHSAQVTLIKSYINILMVIIMSFAFIFIVSFFMCVHGIKLPELVKQMPDLPEPMGLTASESLSWHRAGPQLKALYIEDLFTFQRNHYCCGLHSYKDWTSIGQRKIPDACCKTYSVDCAADAKNNLKNINTHGCYDAIAMHHRDLKESQRYIRFFAMLCNAGVYYLIVDGLYSLYLVVKCLQIIAFCEGRNGACSKICHCLGQQNKCCLCFCMIVMVYLLICAVIVALVELGLIT